MRHFLKRTLRLQNLPVLWSITALLSTGSSLSRRGVSASSRCPLAAVPSGRMQHHVDMDGVEGKDYESILGLAQDAGVEQRTHVAVHRLHVAIHPARRFADRQRSCTGEGAGQFQSLCREKSKQQLWRGETDARALLVAFQGGLRTPFDVTDL